MAGASGSGSGSGTGTEATEEADPTPDGEPAEGEADWERWLYDDAGPEGNAAPAVPSSNCDDTDPVADGVPDGVTTDDEQFVRFVPPVRVIPSSPVRPAPPVAPPRPIAPTVVLPGTPPGAPGAPPPVVGIPRDPPELATFRMDDTATYRDYYNGVNGNEGYIHEKYQEVQIYRQQVARLDALGRLAGDIGTSRTMIDARRGDFLALKNFDERQRFLNTYSVELQAEAAAYYRARLDGLQDYSRRLQQAGDALLTDANRALHEALFRQQATLADQRQFLASYLEVLSRHARATGPTPPAGGEAAGQPGNPAPGGQPVTPSTATGGGAGQPPANPPVAAPAAPGDGPKQPTPSIQFPGDIPNTQAPGPGFVWRGQQPEGGRQGNWFNPRTGESLSNDMQNQYHGPHWDYRIQGERGKWRWYPDGRLVHSQ